MQCASPLLRCIPCSSSLTAAGARVALGHLPGESGSILLRLGIIIFASAPVFRVRVMFLLKSIGVCGYSSSSFPPHTTGKEFLISSRSGFSGNCFVLSLK